MNSQVTKLLKPFRSRLTRRRAIGALLAGMFWGGAAGCLVGLAALLGGSLWLAAAAGVVLVAVPLAWVAATLFKSPSWTDVARVVDRHGGTHDAATSALYLASEPSDEFAAIQAEQAIDELKRVSPARAVPIPFAWESMAKPAVLYLVAGVLCGMTWWWVNHGAFFTADETAEQRPARKIDVARDPPQFAAPESNEQLTGTDHMLRSADSMGSETMQPAFLDWQAQRAVDAYFEEVVSRGP